MNKPLQGRRILVTRPAAQSAALASLIAERGGEAICFPLLDIRPVDDWQPLDDAIVRLDRFALAIFISPNAVEFSLPRLLARRPWPACLQAAAIGPGTVSRLADFGITETIVPQGRYDSEALLALPPLQVGAIAGKQVLILRGNGGRELLAETLGARGATVECVACYRREPPSDSSMIVSLLRNNGLDALTLSSSEGLRNLLDMLDTGSRERLLALPVFVPHQRIVEEAKRHGLSRVMLTGPADAGLVESLCDFCWLDHE